MDTVNVDRATTDQWVRALWGAPEKIVGGIALNHIRNAAPGAPTLVLLHGICCSRSTWAPLIPHLMQDFHILILDLPGHGHSAKLPRKATVTDMARRIDDALTAEEVERPWVMGNSLGGWVALELATLRDLSGVTGLAPAGLWAPGFKITPWLRAGRTLTRFSGVLARPVMRWGVLRMLFLQQASAAPHHLSPTFAYAAARSMARARSFKRCLYLLEHSGFSGRQSISPQLPVDILFGQWDSHIPHDAGALSYLPTHATVETVEGAGHVLMWDTPRFIAERIKSHCLQAA